MRKLYKNQGFTLIEILVSVSIIGILSLLIVQSFFTSLRSNTKTELMKDLKQNGDNAMQTIVRTIQNAQSVTVCDLNALTLQEFDGNTITISSYSDNGTCRIKSESTSPAATYSMTSSNISMPGTCENAISFTCDSIGNKISSVTVSFSLIQKGSPPDAIDIARQDFSSSIVVRNRQ